MSKNDEISENDVWDDSLLIHSYDKSVNLARKALAKKIAQATNSIKNNKSESSASTDTDEPTPQEPETTGEYKVGDYVRATYDDGVDYEARIIAIDKSLDECRLKYIGYENEQTVKIADLIPTWGKKARKKQFKVAKWQDDKEPKEDGDVSTKSFQMPEMYGRLPPPPPMPPHLSGEDSEHLSAMLMSWYMSGYYTGYYHGQKAQKRSKRN